MSLHLSKTRTFGAFAAAGIALVPALALAQQQQEPSGYGYGPYMMNWAGGWYGMFFGPLFMIIILALVIAVAVLLVRWLSGSGHPLQPPMPPQRTPLDILKERFARGEIDKDEFEERRRVLGE